MKKVAFLILLLLLMGIAHADLSVHFLDVGQGDAALVICDGEAMLIDGGPVSASQFLYTYLRKETDSLSVMIATHPHDDHIGGLAAVLNAVPVDVIYSPVTNWNSKAWDSLFKYASAQGTLMLQPFAMGGEGANGLDPAIRYRSSLQNFVIDTGSEVILVDTGLPDGVPNQVPDEKTVIYMGTRIQDYLDALKALGYTPDNISKILVTHKHADHTGLLAAFPNATIYASPEEAQAQELALPNVTAVAYKDGPYYNFPSSEKIVDGVYFLPAKGHTTGNSIVIVEDGDLFYMLHGDVTYTDEALYANKLSVVYEDVGAARETLDQVRAFISENPTVYLSTHTPLGVENLENKAVIDLNNPPESIPPTEVAAVEATGKYICSVCGYVYDPAEHDGVAFEALPDDWKCPRCKQGKEKFGAA